MASFSHQHTSSNVPSDHSSSNPESTRNPFDAFHTQSRSNHGTSDHHSGSNNSNDFSHDFVSVHGSQLSDQPSSSQPSSSRSSESDPYMNSHMSTTFATANTNSIPLHQPSGSGNSYSSHSATSMHNSNSYHRLESLSMLNHQPQCTSTTPLSHPSTNPPTTTPSPTIESSPANIATTIMTRSWKNYQYPTHRPWNNKNSQQYPTSTSCNASQKCSCAY